MSFTSLYRASFYLMLTFATLVLSVDAHRHPIAMLYPLAVAVAGVLALPHRRPRPALGLPRDLANFLALASLGLVYLEYKIDPNLLLLALAHWLVYLQLIKMFLPKTVEDDWFLFLLGLMQVLVGAVDQPERHGRLVAASCWALLAALGAGPVLPASRALRRASAPAVARPSRAVAVDPYPGLFDLAVRARDAPGRCDDPGAGRPHLPGHAPAADAWRRDQGGRCPRRHLTGFDDEVKLGQLGEILENDSVVMSVELFDDERKPVAPPREPLWRGVTHGALRERALAAAAERRRASHGSARAIRKRWPSAGDPPADQARAERLRRPVRPPADARALDPAGGSTPD